MRTWRQSFRGASVDRACSADIGWDGAVDSGFQIQKTKVQALQWIVPAGAKVDLKEAGQQQCTLLRVLPAKMQPHPTCQDLYQTGLHLSSIFLP